MNLISYQLNSKGHLYEGKDVVLNKETIIDLILSRLGEKNCLIINHEGNKTPIIKYTSLRGNEIFLIISNVTYMGGDGKNKQHPLSLKRIQLKKWFKPFYENNKNSSNLIKFAGLYPLLDSNNNVNDFILVDFEPKTYLQRNMNNSSAHVFLNDLFQSFYKESFSKIDKRGNKITTIHSNNLEHYLNTTPYIDSKFAFFDNFNSQFEWNKWITAEQAITYMYEHNSVNYKQNLWNGWYLECRMDSFISQHKDVPVIYLDTSNDTDIINKFRKYDLDLVFKEDDFLGDLKATSSKGTEIILNDKSHTDHALKDYKRIWYIIYVHEKKDGKTNNYEMVRWRNRFISQITNLSKDELSAKGTPHSICFTNMVIVEINSINYIELLSKNLIVPKKQFGKNSDGHERKEKYYLKKKIINDDNFVIYRYNPQ